MWEEFRICFIHFEFIYGFTEVEKDEKLKGVNT